MPGTWNDISTNVVVPPPSSNPSFPVNTEWVSQRPQGSALAMVSNQIMVVENTGITVGEGDYELSGNIGFTGVATSLTAINFGVSQSKTVMPGTAALAVPDIIGQVLQIANLRVTLLTFDDTRTIGTYSFSVPKGQTKTFWLLAQTTITTGSVSVYGMIRIKLFR